MSKGKLIICCGGTLLIACGILSSSQARAGGFVLVQAPPAVPTAAPAPPKGAVDVDAAYVPPGSPAPERNLGANDWGADVPLDFAARSILPDGFLARVDQSVPAGTVVTWHGPGKWQDVLGRAIASQGLAWSQAGQLISIYKPGAGTPAVTVPVVPVAAHPGVPQSGGIVPSAPNVPYGVPPVAVPAAPENGALPGGAYVDDVPRPIQRSVSLNPHGSNRHSPTEIYGPADGGTGMWYAPKGQTLAAVLAAWADQSGWSFKYEAVGIAYRLDAPLALQGSFTDAVSSLVYSIAAEPRPTVVFHTKNKMLVLKADQG